MRHDVKKRVQKFVMKSTGSSWRQKHVMKSKSSSWRQKHVMKSNNTSWRQRHVMTSKSASWRQNTSLRQKVRHDVKDNRYKIKNLEKKMQKSYDFWFKSYSSNSGFNVFDDLDLQCMFYWLSQKVGMKYWISLPSFIRIRHVLMGDMAAVKVLKNVLCFIIGYLVAMEIRVTLFCMMINRYKNYEFRKHAKIVCYIYLYYINFTWRQNGKSYVMGIPLIDT